MGFRFTPITTGLNPSHLPHPSLQRSQWPLFSYLRLLKCPSFQLLSLGLLSRSSFCNSKAVLLCDNSIITQQRGRNSTVVGFIASQSPLTELSISSTGNKGVNSIIKIKTKCKSQAECVSCCSGKVSHKPS